jgi:hypothetical protein
MIGSCGALLAFAMSSLGAAPISGAVCTECSVPSTQPCNSSLAFQAKLISSEGNRGRTLCSADAAADEAGEAYRDRARSTVREVLSRREFGDLHADGYASWRRLLLWLGGLFQRLTSALRGLPPGTFWTVLVLIVIVLVAILAHLIYTLVMLFRGTSLTKVSRDARSKITGELLGIQELDFDKVYAEARRLMAAGEWAAATRYFYVAAILWLDRQGWIVFKRSKTNCDYIAELARRGTAQAPFRRLTQLFEPVVYGGNQPTTSTMHDISNTVEELLHEPAVSGPC